MGILCTVNEFIIALQVVRNVMVLHVLNFNRYCRHISDYKMSFI